jgi:hypothetical protein
MIFRRARLALPFRYSQLHILRLCLFTPLCVACTGLLGIVLVQGRIDMLQRSSFWSVALTDLFLLFALRHILKTQTRLTIDAKGVDYRVGRNAQTYAWDDIAGVRSIVADAPRTIRMVEILTRGQEPSALSHRNCIYCKAIAVDDLTRLINEGRERWAAA